MNNQAKVINLEGLEYYQDNYAYGTVDYHYLGLLAKPCNMVATDGIKWLCDDLDCYWIIDLIAPITQKLNDFFYVVYIIPNSEGGFYLILDDGNNNIVSFSQYAFTDLEVNLKLYLARSEHWVLMLPSEY